MLFQRAAVTVTSGEALVLYLAKKIVNDLSVATRERGRALLVLAGGSTFKAVYSLLATEQWLEKVPWDKVTILFGDERSAHPDHEHSNYKMAYDSLLRAIEPRGAIIHRMEGELKPEEAVV